MSSLAEIWKMEGIRGLYRGLGPTTLGYIPSWTVYFTVYGYAKQSYNKLVDEEMVVHLLAAMTAGVCVPLTTNPVWVIKTRMMARNRCMCDRVGRRRVNGLIDIHWTRSLPYGEKKACGDSTEVWDRL
jgi:hypothetical protein